MFSTRFVFLLQEYFKPNLIDMEAEVIFFFGWSALEQAYHLNKVRLVLLPQFKNYSYSVHMTYRL